MGCPFICIRCRRCWRTSKGESRSVNASLEAIHAYKDLQARSELFDLTASLGVQNTHSQTCSISIFLEHILSQPTFMYRQLSDSPSSDYKIQYPEDFSNYKFEKHAIINEHC